MAPNLFPEEGNTNILYLKKQADIVNYMLENRLSQPRP